MTDLTSLKTFDEFIDKVLPSDSNDSSLTNQIQTWAKQSIIQLNGKKDEAIKIDDLKVKNITNQINCITTKINLKFRNMDTLEEINNYINQMEQIKKNYKINDHKDFIKLIKECFNEFESDIF